mmetsp:Transcript_18473/g.29456  ORF Transcript_18473/g.29456 Transcript_18473/m.29456 type:complete len:581 (-) Transcript_18473:101-1843(-)
MDQKAAGWGGDTSTAVNGKTEIRTNGSSTHSNGNKVKDGRLKTESGFDVKKDELVRLMVQSMKAIGCSRSAKTLEEESGILLEKQCVKSFRRGIEDGDWKKVRDLLPSMSLSKKDLDEANMLVHEEEFLELLEQGKTTEALETLRRNIAPSHPSKNRINKLSSLVIYPTSEAMRMAANWEGVKGGSRTKLLNKMQRLMDPSFVVPQFRLLTLIDQALSRQVSKCQFHNTKLKSLTLLHDHSCSLGEIPKTCLYILDEHKDEVWCVKFSNKGDRVASASKDKSVIIWEVGCAPNRSPRVMFRLHGHSKPPSFLSWSSNDKLLLSSDNTSCFKVWDLETQKCLLAVPARELPDSAPDSVMACAWHPDGKHVISGSLVEKKIVTWNLNGSKVHVWDLQHAVRDLCVSTTKGLVVVLGTDNGLRIYDCETRTRLKSAVKESSPVTSFCLSKDGRFALLSVAKPAAIRLWDLNTGELVRHYEGIKQSRYVVQASFGGSEEMFVVSGSEDSQVYIWHRTSGELLAVLPAHSGTVNSVTWSPVDPQRFVSGSDDGTVRLWSKKSVQKNGFRVHDHEKKNGLLTSKKG